MSSNKKSKSNLHRTPNDNYLNDSFSAQIKKIDVCDFRDQNYPNMAELSSTLAEIRNINLQQLECSKKLILILEGQSNRKEKSTVKKVKKTV
jgi:hypothetical protein